MYPQEFVEIRSEELPRVNENIAVFQETTLERSQSGPWRHRGPRRLFWTTSSRERTSAGDNLPLQTLNR